MREGVFFNWRGLFCPHGPTAVISVDDLSAVFLGCLDGRNNLAVSRQIDLRDRAAIWREKGEMLLFRGGLTGFALF